MSGTNQKPSTLALDSDEWRALLLSNLVRAHTAVNGSATIAPEGVVQLCQHLDRMKGIVAAWHASQTPAQVRTEQIAEGNPQAAHAPLQANGNGAETVKKKGGWPLGKPRKRNNPHNEAMQ